MIRTVCSRIHFLTQTDSDFQPLSVALGYDTLYVGGINNPALSNLFHLLTTYQPSGREISVAPYLESIPFHYSVC